MAEDSDNSAHQSLNLQQRVIQSGLDSIDGADANSVFALFKGMAVFAEDQVTIDRSPVIYNLLLGFISLVSNTFSTIVCLFSPPAAILAACVRPTCLRAGSLVAVCAGALQGAAPDQTPMYSQIASRPGTASRRTTMHSHSASRSGTASRRTPTYNHSASRPGTASRRVR